MQTDPATLNRLAAECMEPRPTEPPPPESWAHAESPKQCWQWCAVDSLGWTLDFNPANSEADAVRFAEWFVRDGDDDRDAGYWFDTETALCVRNKHDIGAEKWFEAKGPFPLALTTAILTALGKLEQSND